MKAMKSMMRGVVVAKPKKKPVTSSKDTSKKKNSKEKKSVMAAPSPGATTPDQSAKKNSKEKKSAMVPPSPHIAPAPVTTVAGGPDLVGLSTKKARKGKSAEPPPAGKTMAITVQEPPKKEDVFTQSPAQSPMNSPAVSPITATASTESPFNQPEQDIPMEPDAPVDPEKESRSIAGRDPDTMNPDQLANLKAFILQYEKVGVQGLLEEFNSIKGYNLQPFDITGHEANPLRNRYQDIFCIEPSRVKLMDGKEGDYIHANYVKGAPFLNNFITTQGPLEPTVNDFWRLVVQENVGYIFMLCSIIELGKKKCEQYIPETEGEMRFYGDIKVTLEKKDEDGHFINSKLLMEAPGKGKKILYHHFWKNWPDRGVPITAMAGLRLLQHARKTTFATIVHCSAGVGRTGTLVAIEWLLQKILTSCPPYDMKEMLRAVRNQRAHAIQTAPQYAYIAFAIFRLWALLEPTQQSCFHKFSADMQTYAGVVLPPPPPGAGPAVPTIVPGTVLSKQRPRPKFPIDAPALLS